MKIGKKNETKMKGFFFSEMNVCCSVRENKTESYFTKLTQLNYFYAQNWVYVRVVELNIKRIFFIHCVSSSLNHIVMQMKLNFKNYFNRKMKIKFSLSA